MRCTRTVPNPKPQIPREKNLAGKEFGIHIFWPEKKIVEKKFGQKKFWVKKMFTLKSNLYKAREIQEVSTLRRNEHTFILAVVYILTFFMTNHEM